MLATKLLVPLALLLTLGFGRPLTDHLTIAPDPPGPVTFDLLAVGDTLVYRVGWGSGARASSYDVTLTVAVTNGTWSTLRDSTNCNVDPNCGHVPGAGMGVVLNTSGLYRKTWLTAMPWDSATFTASVASRNAGGLSAAVTASRRAMRPPGPPGPVTIDSALVLTGLPVFPATAMMIVGTDRVTCGFFQFGNGAIAERTIDRSICDTIYWKYVPLDAQTVTAAQQAFVDTSTVP